MMMPRAVILIRHGRVHERYRGICYGRSDVELGPAGHHDGEQAALAVHHLAITQLHCSRARRSQALADHIAAHAGLTPIIDARLDERDHGDWELCAWDDIYARTGAAMDGFIDAPDRFAPPGGETTFQMRDRVLAWYRDLPEHGIVVAVSHGGPIAALRGTLRGLHVRDWMSLVPAHGQVVRVP
jgi:broad specificity phosphatase PhoE